MGQVEQRYVGARGEDQAFSDKIDKRSGAERQPSDLPAAVSAGSEAKRFIYDFGPARKVGTQ
jgi:hypothetical protein